MRSLIAKLSAVCIVMTLFAATPAQASHDSPLYQAASEYRQAARNFERSVIRSRYLQRQHRRAADDLEDATARLLSASRNPRHSDRLFEAWNEIQYLHWRAEAVIFADPTCPSARELAERWHTLQVALDQVAYELAGYGWHPTHLHPPVFNYLPIDDHLPVVLPPIIEPLPPSTVPYGGSNHPSQWNPNRGVEVVPYWIQQERTNFRGNRVGIPHAPNRQSINTVPAGVKSQRVSR